VGFGGGRRRRLISTFRVGGCKAEERVGWHVDFEWGEVLFGLECEEKNRGIPKGEDDEDDGTAFCLRLNETLHTGQPCNFGCMSAQGATYCSGSVIPRPSSCSNASSSLTSSATVGCLVARLEDASACPGADWRDDELDMPYVRMKSGVTNMWMAARILYCLLARMCVPLPVRLKQTRQTRGAGGLFRPGQASPDQAFVQSKSPIRPRPSPHPHARRSLSFRIPHLHSPRWVRWMPLQLPPWA
jgi:hypothetical protein